ncbi:Predicted arabinose efflux permease, MFS family [Pseudomonas sp. URIL14HWK12:I9]|nr:putative MFS family arabinose efflux permease [Pseudomonas sp. URIL14HWK12:I12]PVZ27593.1 putative MFS family arabinose efflux permease [Pseudomonas sp. URIL14HWK12:I10]SNZ03181.1 Predicted arabinose efflux permease, MFS family [Pseudomonas sp. URIL14HWK12:I9]
MRFPTEPAYRAPSLALDDETTALTEHAPKPRWPAPVRALAHRDFQIYFVGQGVSTLGKWVQQVALSWLAYHLTASATLLGVITFLSLAPQLLVGPVAGAWIDRRDKRRCLIVAQSLLALQSLLMAGLTWQGWVGANVLVGMALLLGLLNAVETPLRQALIGSFVGDPADLPNALALNAMLINAARFLGPPLAGALIAASGEAVCFLITAFAFALLLLGLAKVQGSPTTKATGSTAQMFREGLAYVWQTVSVRRLMVGVIMVNLLASNYTVLLPVLAKTLYLGDARMLGWLWGAAGAGAFVATIALALGGALHRLERVITCAALACALALILMAFKVPLPAALVLLAVLGCGITANNVSTNMLLQSGAPEHLRGRVVALYIALRFGFEAVGGLLAGLLASLAGAPVAMGAAGLVLVSFLALESRFSQSPK